MADRVVLLGGILLYCLLSCCSSMPQNKNTEIERIHVKSEIKYRFATTQIERVVKNIGPASQVIHYFVTYPKEAFITKFSMSIDGQVYPGKVMQKKAAKKHSVGGSDAHTKQAPRRSKVFGTSANVDSGSEVTFTLTYQEILHRIPKLGVYEQEIHINPRLAVKDFQIEVFVEENNPLVFVRTPALRTDSLSSVSTEGTNQLAQIERPTNHSAYILYKPITNNWNNKKSTLKFVVQYDVEHNPKGDLMAADGFFVHFYTPVLPPMPKDIIFVLDVSGSMGGRKIQQMQHAMLKILGDLQTQDRLNILAFSSNVGKWQSSLIPVSENVITKATTFVNNMIANGGTNINWALLEAVNDFKSRALKKVPIVFFLTDGEASSGETDTSTIASNVKSANTEKAKIFCVGFGDGADYGFLDTICAQNSGTTTRIYEDADASNQVTGLYKKISDIVLTNLTIRYLSDPDADSITNMNVPVVFNGSEIIISGPLAPNTKKFEMEISGQQKSGPMDMLIEVDDISEMLVDSSQSENSFFNLPRDNAATAEKMWAFTTIKQLMTEKEKHAGDPEKTKEILYKALDLSIHYDLVTPVTSMVVSKPGKKGSKVSIQEELEPEDPDNTEKTYTSLPVLSTTTMDPMTALMSQPPYNALVSITFRSQNLTMCLSTSSIKPGVYNILKTSNGAELRMTFEQFPWRSKVDTRMYKARLRELTILRSRGNMTAGDKILSSAIDFIGPKPTLTMERSGQNVKVDTKIHQEQLQSTQNTNVTNCDKKNTVVFADAGFVGKISAELLPQNTLILYHLNLVLSPQHEYISLLGHMMNPSKKTGSSLNKKTKTPPVCKDMNADISGDIAPFMSILRII